MNRKANPLVAVLIAFAVAALVFIVLNALTSNRLPEDGASRTTEPDEPPLSSSPPDSNIHLTMGNPSHAIPDPRDADNFLMRKPYFALSYNGSKGTPNWVSWCLRESDLGSAPRVPFYPDPDLPRSFKHVLPRDYNGTGFDRGHMCPHSDRGSTPEASTATFVMTNLIPQSPACNQKAWADLEGYCRGLAKKHQTLYIVAGPEGKGGTGTKGPAESIAGDKVTVPARCWKVVLVIHDGTGSADDVSKVGRDTRLFGVVMPNDETVGHGWAKYRTSVKEVETLTGYRFFDRVPEEIIEPLKAKVDREHIPAGHPRKTED
jgi:endonuclease G